VTALLILTAAAGAAAQDRLAAARGQFQADRDVVHQARNFSKLGDALLDEMRKQADAGDVPAALAAFAEFRDDLRRILAGLKATGHNAEKRPSGFKELQIYLRKTLRSLDQIILLVPFDRREPFDGPRRDVALIDEELFHLLFPRQPAPGAGGKPQGGLLLPGLRDKTGAFAEGGNR
jgi:hypothetical protein